MEWKWFASILACLLAVTGRCLAASSDVPIWNPETRIDPMAYALFVSPLPSPMPSSPYVVSVYPADGSVDVPASTTILITFDVAMNKMKIPSAIIVDPFLDSAYTWRADNEFILVPNTLDYNTLYHITVTTDAESQTGLKMQSPYEFSFKTARDKNPPQVTETYPQREGASLYPLSWLKIFFSETMMDDVASSVSIDQGMISSPTWYRSNRTLMLDARALQPNQMYKVTIRASLARDLSSNILDGNRDGTPGDDYVFFFSIITGKPAAIVAKAIDTASSTAIPEVEFTLMLGDREMVKKSSGAGDYVRFSGMAPGNYTVIARKRGYSEAQVDVALTSGSSKDISMQMTQTIDLQEVLLKGGLITTVIAIVIVSAIVVKRTLFWRCPMCKTKYWWRYSLCPKCGYDIHTKSNIVITFKRR